MATLTFDLYDPEYLFYINLFYDDLDFDLYDPVLNLLFLMLIEQ